MAQRHGVSNPNHSDAALASGITLNDGLEDTKAFEANTKDNINSEVQPQKFENDIESGDGGNAVNTDEPSIANAETVTDDTDEILYNREPKFSEMNLLGAVGDQINVDDSQELHFDELNDLGKNIENVFDEYMEFNITTDIDDIDETEDKDVPLREYQKELAKEGCAGDNVIVMAPTNTGKTRVAFKIVQDHLRAQRRQHKIGRVIFLVENEVLAIQQGKACAETLPAYRTKIITGSLQRDKQQFLKDFVNRRDILIATAQVLLNALILKEIPSLTTFSMIVFDECHHTNNNHRFNEIMSRYMDLKLDENPDMDNLPQIVGLTASIGVGGNVSEDLAMKHMKEILANLDAKHLCTVRQNKEELQRYENNPKERIVTACKRPRDPYRDAILQIMADIDQYMINHPVMATIPKNDEFIKTACRVPPCGGTQPFLQWLSEFAKAVGQVRSSDICSLLNPCREHLEVYNKALMIHADARRQDAETILDKFMTYQAVIESKVETEVVLMGLYNGLNQKDFSNEPENPKLLKLQEIIWRIHGNNDDARGIVFVKTRELADALTRWMNETPPLTLLNGIQFVGQAAAAARGGTTKSRQKDVLEYFKGGRHKIVIATSVAEEGLDITKCNLVIRYEHVTNEIVRLQSRGRARANDSRYYVITEEGSWIVAKEEKNEMLERLMNRIIPALQVYIENHPNIWEEELVEIQTTKKLEVLKKAQDQMMRLTTDVKELRCFNCDNFICYSSDLRKIQNSHHVAIEEEVITRIISKRDPHPQFTDGELKFDGDIFCGQQDCQRKLGGICEYKNAEFPLLSIKQFRVVDKNGKSQRFKQWKLANFEPEPFTIEDLRKVALRRRARIE